MNDVADTFWLIPGGMVFGAVISAIAIVDLDRREVIPKSILESPWLYNGAATGGRTLLGVVASSTIGVAGTVFSITIAALSLAAGQMGPRLLRNFTRDRGNQVSLGIFLGTFSYALVVLRSVRVRDEGEFVPHLALSIAIALALISVATLVFFVAHIAGRINVDTVIELVSGDVQLAVQRNLRTDKPSELPAASYWQDATAISDKRQGYLQQIDQEALADWAESKGTVLRLLIRPGSFILPGATIGFVWPAVDGAGDAVVNATALGPQRASDADLEFEVRQLVEVAVRALSPGLNDPHTAMSVVDRLGAALCEISPLYFPTGVVLRNDRPALIVSQVDYDGLTDTMFHMIRQNAAGNAAVLIKILDVLSMVLTCERDLARLSTLRRHADLILADAIRTIGSPADLREVKGRHSFFARVQEEGASALR